MKKLTLLVFLLLISVQQGSANWVDSWIDQQTSSSPNHFSTAERSYANFGGYSARWQPQTDPFVSYTPPKFKVGCGGIDLFLGGFQFMRMDHLVEKFKRIMGPAAAAFAFNLALGTLSEQADKYVGRFTAVMDRLNQLQFDECKAGQTMATLVTGPTSEMKAQDRSEVWTTFVNESGAGDLYTDVVDAAKGRTADSVGNDNGATAPDMVSGCPDDVIEVFFTEGSFFENARIKNGLPESFTNMFIGLIGDILISSNLNYSELKGCSKNSQKTLTALVNGDLEVYGANSTTCSQVGQLTVNGIPYANMNDWIATELVGIGHVMATSAPFSGTQEALLQYIPGPVIHSMKATMSFADNSEAQTINEVAIMYAEYSAYLIGYNMMLDIYSSISDTIELVKTIKENKLGSDDPNNQDRCQLKLSEDAMNILLRKQKKLYEIIVASAEEFSEKQETMSTQLATVKRMMECHEHFLERSKEVLEGGK